DYQFLYMVENNTVDYIHNFDTMSCEISNLALGAEGAEYFYDGAGRRLEATRSGELTLYILDASGNVLAEADGTGITRYYIYGLGLVAMITETDDLYTYHFNAVGSTMAITDASETVVNKYSYDSFGALGNQVETIKQPFKFVGQHGVMAEPNGLYFMRARYYDPTLGRFLQPDPLGFAGGDVNLYVYASNNPILLIDPWGLMDMYDAYGQFYGYNAYVNHHPESNIPIVLGGDCIRIN
ncbi:MAG: RHS repeat-associated core domain-containing protein, partial [Proteobacteria bacterium]|nr:RHS repeat-associated core domain-containing protein [Pseudomonadota bacterium]